MQAINKRRFSGLPGFAAEDDQRKERGRKCRKYKNLSEFKNATLMFIHSVVCLVKYIHEKIK
jgi:hypothetical protein